MEAMRADHAAVEPAEHLIDEYVRLRGEVTVLQARCAEVLGRIDGEGLFADAGYLSTISMVRDRTGDSWDAARRCVSEARGIAEHPYVREAFASAVIDRPRVAMLSPPHGSLPKSLPVTSRYCRCGGATSDGEGVSGDRVLEAGGGSPGRRRRRRTPLHGRRHLHVSPHHGWDGSLRW